MRILFVLVVAGLSGAWGVVIFHALPAGKRLASTGRKPWACDVCLASWATLGALVGIAAEAGDGRLLGLWPAAAAVSIGVLRWIRPPDLPPPPSLAGLA